MAIPALAAHALATVAEIHPVATRSISKHRRAVLSLLRKIMPFPDNHRHQSFIAPAISADAKGALAKLHLICMVLYMNLPWLLQLPGQSGIKFLKLSGKLAWIGFLELGEILEFPTNCWQL